MPRLQILVAGIRETNRRVAEIFGDCEVTFVDTMEQAQAALSGRYDALLIAVRFDESRMFDLLRCVSANKASARLPIVCYRSTPGPVTQMPLAREAVEVASLALGASAFFDLKSYPNEKSGNLALRELVGKLAAAAGRHPQAKRPA